MAHAIIASRHAKLAPFRDGIEEHRQKIASEYNV